MKNIKISLFRFATAYVPQARDKLKKEVDKMETSAKKKFTEKRGPTSIPHLPEEGQKTEDIVQKIKDKALVSSKCYKDGGNLTGCVYTRDEKHWDFICDVMRASIVSNPLHIDEFIYVTQMEAEIIRWTLDLYNGGEKSCGIVTSGGTESIILAMLAYREKAKTEKGII